MRVAADRLTAVAVVGQQLGLVAHSDLAHFDPDAERFGHFFNQFPEIYAPFGGIIKCSLGFIALVFHISYLHVKPQLFGNLSLGWTVSLRKMIYSGGSKDTRPIYIPGYGLSATSFSAGINYFLVWNFRYRKINVVIQKEPPEEPDENVTPQTNSGSGNNQKMEP